MLRQYLSLGGGAVNLVSNASAKKNEIVGLNANTAIAMSLLFKNKQIPKCKATLPYSYLSY